MAKILFRRNNKAMKGVILSGGKGSRLSPLTDNYPKQLIPIAGKPVLIHCIEYLQNSGITEIAIIVSDERGFAIETELKKHKLNLNIQFIYQDEPRGLAHAVGLAREFTKDEDFIVLLGDNLFDKRLMTLIQDFYSNKSDTLILLKDVTHPYNFGVVRFDKNGQAVELVEKPKHFVSNYAIVGVYIFNKKIYEAIDLIKPSPRGELEITDAIALQVSSNHKVQTNILDSYWYDTGTREGLLDANCRMLLSKKIFEAKDTNIDSSYMFGNISCGEKTQINKSNLMGPIFIGKNVKIINSTIGPYSSIGDNCIIENSEVQSSIIMHSTEIFDSKTVGTVVFKDTVMDKNPMVYNELVVKKIPGFMPKVSYKTSIL
jgi:glucose-1-phosphate thymidylyltransferase